MLCTDVSSSLSGGCFASTVKQDLWQLVSIAFQEWDSRRWSHAKASTPLSGMKSAEVGHFQLCSSSVGRQTSLRAQKMLFVPVSKGTGITALKLCPNVSPPRTRVVPPRFLSFLSVSTFRLIEDGLP